ncbi:MAG: hypothetical protein JW776_13990 [Candidatus Lokiarchaeota archaeon]|nr:hypothetical protein [Candidatus Lokiarchaeota archaeon]
MDSYDLLPDAPIPSNGGEISKKFLELGITSLKNAILYVHNLEYGYNADMDNKWILFKEKKGSCTTKHGVIASLAQELTISIHKYVGVYKFTENVCKGAGSITKKYNIPYIPMVHCFLGYSDYQFDLTEGNLNGKEHSIEEFIETKQVNPFITRKEEYNWYKQVVRAKVLSSPEMKGVSQRIILKAREEAIDLLHRKIKK